MLWTSLLSAFLLTGVAEAAGRSIAHAGKRHVEHAAKRARPIISPGSYQPVVEREEKAPKFLTPKTKSGLPVSLGGMPSWARRRF